MKLTNRTKSRISLAILFLTFDAGVFVISRLAPTLRLDAFTWVMLVFAASLGGAGIAYLFIGDWLRWPFTKEVPHSSNASMVEIEPRYEGWLNGVGVLFCCPICAGTWVGAALLGLMALDYNLGYYAVVALAVGGAGRLVIRLTELLEWNSRYAQERVAELNRRNAREEADKNTVPYVLSSDGKQPWVLKEEEKNRGLRE